MKRKTAIIAGDILTPLGNLQSTWQHLIAGQSGLVLQQPLSGVQEYPMGRIPGLAGRGGSRLRLESLFDTVQLGLPPLPAETQLRIATTKGAVDELLTTGSGEYGQPWTLDSYLQDKFALEGEAVTVSAACASGTLAIIQAAMAIETGSADFVLVVGVDLAADFILAGFDSLKALSTSGAKPFDRTRDGLSLGEAAGWMLLAAEDHVDRNNPPLAWLETWGISCDATHITAPCRNASGLKLVFEQIYGSTKRKIGGINAHGTGTVYNDAMELLAFGEKCREGMPVCSVKGALGHTLGAAGVVEAMLSVESLKKMILPPTVGLIQPEETAMALSGEQTLALREDCILSCNSGFGGINAAVLLTTTP